MTDEKIRQIPLRLRGYAKWLRYYRESPTTYQDPLPTIPDELDEIADAIQGLIQQFGKQER